MKLQIISQNNRGFLSFEIMMAISLFALFTISSYSLNSSMQSIKSWSLRELETLKHSVKNIDNAIRNSSTTQSLYGNNSIILQSDPFTIVRSDFVNSWGDTSCSPRITFDRTKTRLYNAGLSLGAGNNSTDIEVRNSVIYLSTDSATQSQPDLYIIDAKDPNSPFIMSSINTGPGISSIAVAGPYIYAANTSSVWQMQIIDIHNRYAPYVISQLKIPLPEASTTPPKANSVFYKNGYVYLGTNKWDGPELSVIDVKDPVHPFVVGSFETSTLINDIYVKGNLAYLATSDEAQMRVLDISNFGNIVSINTFSSSGWQVQQGRVVDSFEGLLGLGRTVGGINRTNNHEAFLFSTSSEFSIQSSKDIPGGVYGFLIRPPKIYLLTHALLTEFQVWNMDFSEKTYEKSLGSEAVAMSCDWSNIYFATGDDRGFSILSLK